MNATINNTLAADARKALQDVVAVHARSKAEVDAGRFVWRGPSVCPKEGDKVSEKVPADKALRFEEDAANARLFGLLDDIVYKHTGFGGSFSDLILAQENNGYRPTIRESGNEALTVLADAYDLAASIRGLEPSHRPERVAPVAAKPETEKTYHLLKDFGVYKATLVKNFEDNDRGREYDHVRELLARRTQRYTLAELEELFGFLWTSSDECVASNGFDDYTALEVHTAAKKIERGEAVLDALNALKAAVS